MRTKIFDNLLAIDIISLFNNDINELREAGVAMFNEICIYEAKIDKQAEIEDLMREVAEFYRSLPGVIDVKYIKRTHRQKDFNAVKAGEPPIRLTRQVNKVTYVLYLVVEDEEAHARLYVPALEKFYKRWTRCLTTMPKIILGENIV
jgi:hypothetical protein